MPTKTIYFEIDDLNLTQGDADYPELELSALVSFDVHPAEPDVGIFGETADITDWELSIDGESYATTPAFAAALSVALGDSCVDDVSDINVAVEKWIDGEAERLEFFDD